MRGIRVKKFKRILCMNLIMIMIFQLGWIGQVYAANPVQPAPEMLRVEALHNNPPTDVQPPIGYNEFDEYYADLKSDPQAQPEPNPVGSSIYLNYYLQEVNKPYKPVKPVVQSAANIPANLSSDNTQRLKQLSSGTVYYGYSKAYYTYTDGTTTFTSSESAASNTVKFMTDIAIDAYSYGPNQIKISWDDVWNSGKRIDYKLYVSENSSFTNTPPIYIGQDQISQNGPVTVNEAVGKLEYIHTVRDPGRVYYIKIVPDVTEDVLKKSPESPTVVVSSYILAKTTKMSVTDFGTIWKLEWSPVVTGIADSSIKVNYQIYKGSADGGNIEQYMASVDDTVFFLTVQPEDVASYYIINAIVTRDGQEVYPGIKIQSEKIYVKESEIPATPGVPELVGEFANAGSVIISYKDELKPNSATILWRAPKKGDGEVDTEVSYDIWLISDPNMLDEPPTNTLIASSVKMSESNSVMSGTTLLGYKYVLTDLMPNSTYYFKIVAKKSYIEFVDNILENVTMVSLPAMKVIITPTDGSIDQPVVPGRPPLELGKTPAGLDAVTETSAVIRLQNKWYEQYMILDGGQGAWVYRTPAQLDDLADPTDPADPYAHVVADIEGGTANPLEFRKVEYDSGVTIDVGCVPYTSDIDYNSLDKLSTNKITGVPVTPNDPTEDVDAEGAIPDSLKHNINITINDLEPNTTYIIWVRAARRSVDLISGPSDPIIITTIPDLGVTLEKPTVPVFNYNQAADNYVDLGWNVNVHYKYYLKYSTVDDIDSATGEIEINPEDLLLTSYYRVGELKPNTLYYFWIRAEASNDAGDTLQSEWSDSLPVKTQPDIPPATPRGFGVKGTADSVTKDTITYEWIMEDGLKYILQVGKDIDYKDATEYQIDGASEFKVENLRSNYRYFARLYAYDPKKDLRSEPTQSIVVRTERSNDDYDSSEDIENVISGDFIIIDDTAVNHVWNINILGVNADRFVQHIQTDNRLDYSIDLRSAPTGTDRISLTISGKVFKALSQLGENLMVQSDRNTLIFRPGMIWDSKQSGRSVLEDLNIGIGIGLNATSAGSDTTNLNFKTPVTALEIGSYDGVLKPFRQLNRPLKVLYDYSAAGWYKDGKTSGYVLPSGSAIWGKADTTGVYDPDSGKGLLSFETLVPGRVAVGEPGQDYYSDIQKNWAKSSIANVASVHKLNAVAGKKFEPDKKLTNGDAAKFMLDMLDYSYGSDYMTKAVKAGLISSADSRKPGTLCTREKLIAMAVRLYELKTSVKAKDIGDDTGIYKDIRQASSSLLPQIRFAVENGIIISRFSDTLGPKDPVTRAETMVLLEKVLKLAGEL